MYDEFFVKKFADNFVTNVEEIANYAAKCQMGQDYHSELFFSKEELKKNLIEFIRIQTK